jgi:hypothetical protein
MKKNMEMDIFDGRPICASLLTTVKNVTILNLNLSTKKIENRKNSNNKKTHGLKPAPASKGRLPYMFGPFKKYEK